MALLSVTPPTANAEFRAELKAEDWRDARLCAVRMVERQGEFMTLNGWPVAMPKILTHKTAKYELEVVTTEGYTLLAAAMTTKWDRDGTWTIFLPQDVETGLCRNYRQRKSPWAWYDEGIDQIAFHELVHQYSWDETLTQKRAVSWAKRFRRASLPKLPKPDQSKYRTG